MEKYKIKLNNALLCKQECYFLLLKLDELDFQNRFN